MNDLTHLSLFSGIGGLDLAAEWAGFRTVGQCEWADYPRAVLEKHWPGLPRWRDIRTLTGDDFFAKTGVRTVDVISGGFPCQPFSTAGKRRGKEDDRYLWPEMLRVIQEIRPAWVVGENVAGLVSMVESNQKFRVESRTISRMPDEDRYEAVLSRHEDTLLVQIIEDIEHIGYEVQAFVIPACAVGAPHRRNRIAIVAHSNRYGCKRAGRTSAEWRNINEKYITVTESCNVSDTDSKRFQIARPQQRIEQVQPENGIEFGGWWPAEPDVGRLAHGVPDRVDRLKCLGNAVVPQQFYPVFLAIADVERMVR